MSKFRPSGGYRTTCSFQTATIVYDATYWFCGKFLDSRSRTVDQMVQPMVLRTAKSGKNAGQQFWGCSAYPDCKGTVKL
jgi:hypothetical protein